MEELAVFHTPEPDLGTLVFRLFKDPGLLGDKVLSSGRRRIYNRVLGSIENTRKKAKQGGVGGRF